jgi:chromosome segregation ATPase
MGNPAIGVPYVLAMVAVVVIVDLLFFRVPSAEATGRVSSQIFTRRVHVPLRFVTIPGMTIPGKGGRPRKWRSDADRVRAFRARQRGEAEPPVLAAALDEGDELAAAWEQVRQLGQQLESLRTAARSARRETAAARRELEAGKRRFGWLSTENDDLRTRLQHVEDERSTLVDELASVVEENAALRRELEALRSARQTAGLTAAPTKTNREERRRAARQARRRA